MRNNSLKSLSKLTIILWNFHNSYKTANQTGSLHRTLGNEAPWIHPNHEMSTSSIDWNLPILVSRVRARQQTDGSAML